LRNKKILITAGPTYEKIDPVRFIGNFSSGKMGYAIAEAAAEQGAEVILISGPTKINISHPNINKIDIVSAAEMYNETIDNFPDVDIAVMCAAVADFTPETCFESKQKRGEEDLIIRLKPTKDIAQAVGKLKKESQVLVGFALETNDEIKNAEKKLEKKNLDFIVLNSLNDKGAGFQTDTNKISIIKRNNTKINYDLKPKTEVAEDIIEQITKCLS
jgi:phosphopantothenoylcysteine decarboxylase/phosphopantothenate--cysteine ligase